MLPLHRTTPQAWIHYMRAGIATADRQARAVTDNRGSIGLGSHSQI